MVKVASILMLGLVIGCSQKAARIVDHADMLVEEACQEYVHGSFESATNALQRCLDYLEANQERIAPYRIMPMTQSAPEAMIARLLIYHGNTNEALPHLSRAYEYHVRLCARSGRSPIPRQDFVQYTLDLGKELDATMGAGWSSEFELSTNDVAEIVAMWIEQRGAE